MKYLSYLKITSEIIFTAITFTLIPVIAFTLITSRTSSFFGFQSFTVLSGSMSPLIPTGSIVYTLKPSSLDIGDIITFKKNDINITHRIVSITDKSGKSISNLASPLAGSQSSTEVFYKTKGDANSALDSDLVSKDKIIGKAIFHFPYVGKFAFFIKTIPGFLAFIIFPTLVFVGFELWNIKKEIEKQTEKKVLERMRML